MANNPLYAIVLTDGQEFTAEVTKIDRINGNLRYKDEKGEHDILEHDLAHYYRIDNVQDMRIKNGNERGWK